MDSGPIGDPGLLAVVPVERDIKHVYAPAQTQPLLMAAVCAVVFSLTIDIAVHLLNAQVTLEFSRWNIYNFYTSVTVLERSSTSTIPCLCHCPKRCRNSVFKSFIFLVNSWWWVVRLDDLVSMFSYLWGRSEDTRAHVWQPSSKQWRQKLCGRYIRYSVL